MCFFKKKKKITSSFSLLPCLLPLLLLVLLTAVDPHSSFLHHLCHPHSPPSPGSLKYFREKQSSFIQASRHCLSSCLCSLSLAVSGRNEALGMFVAASLMNLVANEHKARHQIGNMDLSKELAEGFEDPLLKNNFAGNAWAHAL